MIILPLVALPFFWPVASDYLDIETRKDFLELAIKY